MSEIQDKVLEQLQSKQIVVDDILYKETIDDLVYFELYKNNHVFSIEVEADNCRLPVVFVDEDTKMFHPLTKNFIEYVGAK